MSSHSRRPPQKTPGRVVAEYAFKYSRSFFDFAAKKLPELAQYPPDQERGPRLQAAITAGALIQAERRSAGAGRNELHQDVVKNLPLASQSRQVALIQDLAAELLQASREDMPGRAIPSFADVAGQADQHLIGLIGEWLVRGFSKKTELNPTDAKVGGVLGRNAWTSATMIARMLQPKPKQ
ncbi:MAG TPA: hypothetical protein VN915_17590 [Elusimicrobiota bacterium]|nr:hypothetical protein [Elusimicrobiota bacterium]